MIPVGGGAGGPGRVSVTAAAHKNGYMMKGNLWNYIKAPKWGDFNETTRTLYITHEKYI